MKAGVYSVNSSAQHITCSHIYFSDKGLWELLAVIHTHSLLKESRGEEGEKSDTDKIVK